jgi:hypothetical protein
MMDKVQKYNSFNTNTPSSESYRSFFLTKPTDLQDNHMNRHIFIQEKSTQSPNRKLHISKMVAGRVNSCLVSGPKTEEM